MPKGKIIFFNAKSKFGFIKGENEQEYYVHAKAIAGDVPQEGEEVEFEIREARRGPEAFQVKRIGKEEE
jgi:CspA family cold shock protein